MSKNMSIKEIGQNLAKAGRLDIRPLCIHGSETIPEYAVPSSELHFCISNAIIALALRKDINAIYYGADSKFGVCPGARAWLGYGEFNPFLHYFLSTGYKNTPSENLVATPEIATEKLKSVGKITPVGNYTIVQACETISEDHLDIKAILCYGHPEQIRNLCMLAYFDLKTSFGAIQMPWGSSCSSFITYPAGLAENGPKSSIILGPMDPTDNYFFPPDILAMGIPIDIAEKMSKNIEHSFIIKRSDVAYPKERVNPIEKFSQKDFNEFSKRLFGRH
jgi:hypothetical protein